MPSPTKALNLTEVKDLLKSIEWGGSQQDPDHRDIPACPCCKHIKPNSSGSFCKEFVGHSKGCKLNKLLKKK